MEEKTVLVTGIGGNVGQGIIRNIRSTNHPIRIIGTDINSMSPGNHLVDSFYQVPFSYAPDYLPEIVRISNEVALDLIVPSTDYEVYYLAANRQYFSCEIAGSGVVAAESYLDKYVTSKLHSRLQIPFVKTCLPSEYTGQFQRAIAKPRKGRGSRGITRDIKSTVTFRDDEYIIQELVEGTEMTTAVYASYKTKEFIGLITMERSLENGATTYCKVNRTYDYAFEEMATDMIRKLDLRGSFNIQSMITETGGIFPFEINCRISGTNSIRSHFGFPDVKYTIEELLYDIIPSKPVISEGIAYRYLADVIYPDGVITGNRLDKHLIF